MASLRERASQDQRQKKSKTLTVFAFPLRDMVFFPSATAPLNVFEPRYLKMVRDSLENKTPIALCRSPFPKRELPLEERHERLQGLVCGVGHPMIYQERPDGTLMVFVRGFGKVRLLEVLEENPYLVCRAEELKTDERLDESNRFRLNRIRALMLKWADKYITDPEDQKALFSSIQSPSALVETVAGIFVDSSLDRQRLLQQENVNRQLDQLLEFIPLFEKKIVDASQPKSVIVLDRI